MPGEIISDSSALIALQRIGRLDLMASLFDTIIVPPAVAREVGPSVAQLTWIEERGMTSPLDRRVVAASLGPGETEAISLALELRARRIILDEWPARELAKQLDLPVVGILGVLGAAKRRGVLPAVRPILDALVASGFRLSSAVYETWPASVEEA